MQFGVFFLPTLACPLTNEPRVGQQAVSIVLLQAAANRAWLGLAVGEEICKARSATGRKMHIFKNQPLKASLPLTLSIFGQGLIFFNLNAYWTHFSHWESLSKTHLFPESISEVRTRKRNKAVKRNRTTGCPLLKEMFCIFMPRKKDKDWFYHMRSHFAWIWTPNWSLLSRTEFLLFYWLHKTLRLCSQSKARLSLQAGPALMVSQVSRERAHHPCSAWPAGRTSWHSLLTPQSHSTENLFL